MIAVARNASVAALIIGAVVFAWPAQAAIAQCPRPLFWRNNMPINEAYERMIQFAAKKVAEAPSIFKGHAINAEFIGFERDFHTFIVTFKVTKWIKGSGQPFARIVYAASCDECSSIPDMADEILQMHEEAIYVSDSIDTAFMKGNAPTKNIDGVFFPCSHYGRRVEVVGQQTLAPHIEHKSFLLDLVISSEIEELSLPHHSTP
ncbi:hypothetical protein [Microvirga guangxiensis]|uniref:DUF3298 domain-containing protein n=1 Tax=Microvirga guangxiensis TaxID=549386 RepID=A0A1G5GT33_9HYPH|nr:hypothetical protein [Microvirga guangxiensis]SCY54706.1 hypothetical protein SAMN02927923_01629 [Microvirga guangxiensis]